MRNPTLDDLLALLERAADEPYIGEPVSQLEHGLQAAELAASAGAPEAMVAAALLHDVGHLCDPSAKKMASLGVLDHEAIGAAFLRSVGFREAVTRPVRDHVRAKRYLVARHADYRARLSAASTGTLAYQGGAMSESEASAFEREPGARDALRLRAWDEVAKATDWRGPGLEAYVALLTRLLT
jgi:phosphonate degradation associated HDIG domain protein